VGKMERGIATVVAERARVVVGGGAKRARTTGAFGEREREREMEGVDERLRSRVESWLGGGRAADGPISLQNALALSLAVLQRTSSTRGTTKEVLLLLSSCESVDPGDLWQTVRQVRAAGVRVSIVSLAAQAHVHSRIVRETGGMMHAVPRDVAELKESLRRLLRPPVVGEAPPPALIPVAFPPSVSFASPVPCACHGKLVSVAYQCPRCEAVSCAVPAACPLCARPLLSSPHLAASAHHQRPPAPMLPVGGQWKRERRREATDGGNGGDDDGSDDDDDDLRCVGCTGDDDGPGGWHRCTRCRGSLCSRCVDVVHSLTHQCPTCPIDD